MHSDTFPSTSCWWTMRTEALDSPKRLPFENLQSPRAGPKWSQFGIFGSFGEHGHYQLKWPALFITERELAKLGRKSWSVTGSVPPASLSDRQGLGKVLEDREQIVRKKVKKEPKWTEKSETEWLPAF